MRVRKGFDDGKIPDGCEGCAKIATCPAAHNTVEMSRQAQVLRMLSSMGVPGDMCPGVKAHLDSLECAWLHMEGYTDEDIAAAKAVAVAEDDVDVTEFADEALDTINEAVTEAVKTLTAQLRTSIAWTRVKQAKIEEQAVEIERLTALCASYKEGEDDDPR